MEIIQKIKYLSNSYISIGFSGRGPNFEVSFTLKPVKSQLSQLKCMIENEAQYALVPTSEVK